MGRAAEMLAFIDDCGGVATWSDLTGAGFNPNLISSMAERGEIERETRGVYSLADAVPGDFEAITARWGRAVLSHGTALYLHGLSDRYPLRIEVTVPREYNASNIVAEYPSVIVNRASKDAYPLGIEMVAGMTGASVRVYDKERCICDMLVARKKREADVQTLRSALEGYFKSADKDLAKLGEYARALGVEDELQRYAEVLS